MAANSKIEWCDHTWNPWVGCTKISPACDNCYAEGWAKRSGSPQLWRGERRRTTESYWRQPLKWDRQAAEAGVRYRVFCASLADVFDNQVPEAWRHDLWELIGRTTNLDWLLLTKRPQNIAKMLPVMDSRAPGYRPWKERWPWPNVWLGTTVENQEEAERRVPHLLAMPAAVRFLSCEPLLGELDLTCIPWRFNGMTGRTVKTVNALTGNITFLDPVFGGGSRVSGLDLVIAGGESGPGARPLHPAWARSLRDQCVAAEVPYFFKQWGDWVPTGSVDIYCHGPDGKQRRYPGSAGILWLADGRVCLRDFSVKEHAARIKAGEAYNTRAVEVDHAALEALHASNEACWQGSGPENPLGAQWMYQVGKRAAGRLLDGREWNEMPEVLRHG